MAHLREQLFERFSANRFRIFAGFLPQQDAVNYLFPGNFAKVHFGSDCVVIRQHFGKPRFKNLRFSPDDSVVYKFAIDFKRHGPLSAL